MTKVVNARGAMHEYDKSSKWLIQHRTISAAEMLAANDVGLLPWVPLAQFDGPPEPIFKECRARIDHDAPPDEHENLLAVTQVLAGMRYNDPRLFQILGGREAMIESPVLQEFLAETHRECIILVLVERFGSGGNAVEPALHSITNRKKLNELTRLAAKCPDLETFTREISSPE
jgi:hypothetical protein